MYSLHHKTANQAVANILYGWNFEEEDLGPAILGE